MKTPQWIKKLGGTAGEYYVAAELSKRGILNVLLPENIQDDDIMIAKKDSKEIGFIQVKSCYPKRGKSFPVTTGTIGGNYKQKPDNQYIIFVWLGDADKNEPPKYWITTKKEVGHMISEWLEKNPGKESRKLRFGIPEIGQKMGLNVKKEWENNWDILKEYKPDI